MSLLFRAYPLVRPALFAMEPEAAHAATMAALKYAHRLGLTALLRQPPHRPRQVLGLSIANPIGLAAGLDKNGDYIDELASLGFGFLEIGTVTPLAQSGNPLPRLFRLPKAQALINRMGFNNEGLGTFLANVQRSRYRSQGGVLGLNIGKNAATPMAKAVDDYLLCLDAVYPHADYVTINISSPNTRDLRALQGADEMSLLLQRLHDAREELSARHGRRVPLVVKVAPDLDIGQIDAIAALLPRYGIDGVVATNTTVSRAAVTGLPDADQAGGLSGPPVRDMSLFLISRLREQAGKGLAIIGVGGIMQAQDAVDKIAAGADAVQLYTGLIYRGPSLVGECARAVDAMPSR
jgi:dihydroorotate dehydrogenase